MTLTARYYFGQSIVYQQDFQPHQQGAVLYLDGTRPGWYVIRGGGTIDAAHPERGATWQVAPMENPPSWKPGDHVKPPLGIPPEWVTGTPVSRTVRPFSLADYVDPPTREDVLDCLVGVQTDVMDALDSLASFDDALDTDGLVGDAMDTLNQALNRTPGEALPPAPDDDQAPGCHIRFKTLDQAVVPPGGPEFVVWFDEEPPTDPGAIVAEVKERLAAWLDKPVRYELHLDDQATTKLVDFQRWLDGAQHDFRQQRPIDMGWLSELEARDAHTKFSQPPGGLTTAQLLKTWSEAFKGTLDSGVYLAVDHGADPPSSAAFGVSGPPDALRYHYLGCVTKRTDMNTNTLNTTIEALVDQRRNQELEYQRHSQDIKTTTADLVAVSRKLTRATDNRDRVADAMARTDQALADARRQLSRLGGPPPMTTKRG